jgi:hypothetical protein
MNVESIPVHAPKSTTKQDSPASIREMQNSLTTGLFKNEPFPSQRIQVNPSKVPTKMGHSLLTDK